MANHKSLPGLLLFVLSTALFLEGKAEAGECHFPYNGAKQTSLSFKFLLFGFLTVSLPRVINFQISPAASPGNITSHSIGELGFHSWLRWKMNITPIPTTSLLYKVARMYFLNLGLKMVKCSLISMNETINKLWRFTGRLSSSKKYTLPPGTSNLAD